MDEELKTASPGREDGASLRPELSRYIRRKYHCPEEYLWARYPDYGVFRHGDNRKWFALVAGIPRSKLGLPGEEKVDVVNLKLESLLLADLLTRQEGYFPGYHMSRGTWISILLDGTVPLEEIRGWIDQSYRVTASPGTQRALRPPKEWLIPANPGVFDVVHAFDSAEEIRWKQAGGVKKGDTVYLYVGAPVSAILFQCKVTQTDLLLPSRREQGALRRMMMLRLRKRYDPDRFPFALLREKYHVGAVRGPRGIPEELSRALKNARAAGGKP